MDGLEVNTHNHMVISILSKGKRFYVSLRWEDKLMFHITIHVCLSLNENKKEPRK